jgi:hypothetical protein
MAGAHRRPAWVAVEGAANVRDLGGLALRDGGATASCVLLRADNLQALPSGTWHFWSMVLAWA